MVLGNHSAWTEIQNLVCSECGWTHRAIVF